MAVSSDPIGCAIKTIAEIHQRFKQKLFAATQSKALFILTTLVVFLLQLYQKLLVVSSELVLHLFRNIVNYRPFLVISHGIIKSQIDITYEILETVKITAIETSLDGSEIHRTLDAFKVIRKVKFNRIHGDVKHPTILMVLQWL